MRFHFTSVTDAGSDRDAERKEHPCLIPYAELPDTKKPYDRNAALDTLKAIIALGYGISGPSSR